MTEPVLPPESDDSDVGWDAAAAEPEDDEGLRRLLDERPPHHDH